MLSRPITLIGRRWSFLFALALVLTLVASMSANAATPRILLVGDSWAQFMWAPIDAPGGAVFREALKARGMGQWEDLGRYTAIGTTMAWEWANNKQTPYGFGYLDGVRNELTNYPNIDICHVSLGGNDLGRADYRPYLSYTEYSMQSISFSWAPTSGSFTLTFNGETTAPIPYNATAAQVQAALEALSTIGAGNVSVVDTSGGARYFCTFKGRFDGQSVPLMSIQDLGLGTATVTTSINHAGGIAAGENYIYIVPFSTLPRQNDVVTVDGDSTLHYIKFEDSPPIPDMHTKYRIEPALGANVTDGATVTWHLEARVNGVEFNHGWQRVWGTDSPAEVMFIKAVCNKIRVVVETCLNVRQDVRVAICDYDYMNDPGGGGTVQDKNEAGGRMAYQKYLLAREISADPRYLNRCYYISPFGLMQYLYGYPDPGTADMPQYAIFGPNGQPGTVSGLSISMPVGYPSYTPFFGGDSRYPSPLSCLLTHVSGDIHLLRHGYLALANYCLDQLYEDWLKQPKVLSVKRATMNPISESQVYNPIWANEVEFDVQFTEPVNGVDESDFHPIMRGGVAGASVISVEQAKSADTFTVKVKTGGGEGTLGLAVIDDGSIKNEAGTELAGDIDGGFTIGEAYTISKSAALPVAAWPVVAALLAAGTALVRRKQQ